MTNQVHDEDFCAKKYKRYMQLKLIERYQPCYLLSYQHMLNNGLGGAIRSQRRVLPGLQEYLDGVTEIGSIRFPE